MDKPDKALDTMKRKIDSDGGRDASSRRLGIIEPVCGNSRHAKRRKRFTLRGGRQVHPPWQMDGLGHNIEQRQRCGRLEERLHVRGRRAA